MDLCIHVCVVYVRGYKCECGSKGQKEIKIRKQYTRTSDCYLYRVKRLKCYKHMCIALLLISMYEQFPVLPLTVKIQKKKLKKKKERSTLYGCRCMCL